MVKKRRRHTAAYKFRIALEAVEGSKTISQLSSEHEIHANLISGPGNGNCWKTVPVSSPATASTNSGNRRPRKQSSTNRLGRLKMELEWLKKKVSRFGS